MEKVFLDTNVIVYTTDPRFPDKRVRAVQLVEQAVGYNAGVVSTQVMAEYASVAVSKLRQEREFALKQLVLMERMEVVQVDGALIRRGLELQDRYAINFWDATIIAAAEYANCSTLLSEDLNPGQLYTTVRVENPFAS